MKNNMKNNKIVGISDISRGFYKVTYESGIYEYVTEKRLKKLQADKGNKSPETKQQKEAATDDKVKDLEKLKKDALVEIAQRLGFEGEINNDVTKAILIEYIIANDK